VTNLVAVTDEKVEAAGAITYWRLSGHVDAVVLQAAWEDAGLDPKWLTAGPGVETCLRRAMQELAGPHRLVRPLKGSGYALVDEVADEETLSYGTTLKAKLKGESVEVTPPSHDLAQAVLDGYAVQRMALTTEDISSWLTRLIKRVGAVPLRDTGGVYFVPRTHLDTWRTIGRVLRTAGANVVYEIPALRSDEAVEAILDALQTEAEREAKALESELEKGELTSRALKGRASKTEQMLAKIQSYEGLLGQSLDVLKKRVEDLQANITVAIFQADSEEAA
jgi:hypothetical protein